MPGSQGEGACHGQRVIWAFTQSMQAARPLWDTGLAETPVLKVGHTWRTTKDISMEIEATWADVVENLDETAGLARFAGPGGWNDADMLEV